MKGTDAVGTSQWLDHRGSQLELAATGLSPESQTPIQELNGGCPTVHRMSRKVLDGTHWKRELRGDTPERWSV